MENALLFTIIFLFAGLFVATIQRTATLFGVF